ncbi:type II secretion system protein GspK [Stenotrophomonas nitritireducens]|uniref:type II secretion system protein GspK n=1 Tax=Stenotrophomonas nitritireducens TaxID=83617 RepID=UPI003D952380
MTDRTPRADQGFVLVIVLAILVVLALLAAATATSAERAIHAAQADADRFQSELAMAGTRETLLFMLATQRQTIAGLTVNESDAKASTAMSLDDPDGFTALPVGNEIRLDSTPYQGLENTRFSLQDDRGLLSVNWAAPILRQSFYRSLGIASDQWSGLEAKLLDYQDADDLHRLDGAEKSHYASAGLPPPTNRTLATPLELRRVLGWNEALAGMDDSTLLSMFTMTRGSDLNINTAPPQVLGLLPGLTPENTARIVELRRSTPFLSTAQAQQNFGIGAVFDEGLALFAKPSGNLILWDHHSGARHLLHWTLTPFEVNGLPWRIDYEVILPRGNESDQAVVGSPSTPLFPAQGAPGEQQ